MSDRYRLTVNGGIILASNITLENAAMRLCGGEMLNITYMRNLRNTNVVAAIDPLRGVITITNAGTPITPSDPDYPEWVTPLRRLLSITLPAFKEITP